MSSFFFLLCRKGRVDGIGTIQVGENPLLKGTREELKKKKKLERMMEEITGSIVGGREQER